MCRSTLRLLWWHSDRVRVKPGDSERVWVKPGESGRVWVKPADSGSRTYQPNNRNHAYRASIPSISLRVRAILLELWNNIQTKTDLVPIQHGAGHHAWLQVLLYSIFIIIFFFFPLSPAATRLPAAFSIYLVISVKRWTRVTLTLTQILRPFVGSFGSRSWDWLAHLCCYSNPKIIIMFHFSASNRTSLPWLNHGY